MYPPWCSSRSNVEIVALFMGIAHVPATSWNNTFCPCWGYAQSAARIASGGLINSCSCESAPQSEVKHGFVGLETRPNSYFNFTKSKTPTP